MSTYNSDFNDLLNTPVSEKTADEAEKPAIDRASRKIENVTYQDLCYYFSAKADRYMYLSTVLGILLAVAVVLLLVSYYG